MATPMGVLSATLPAGLPSAAPRAAAPVPASVVTVPSRITWRTRSVPLSAMKRLPAESRVSADGW